ncbi:cytochrome P450 [Roseococcus sp. YIM B11640]|uniref:cytochrome P450 n=1 Tax=Roseococcus sp. YIM B11640 TaxID=3133973 RepID=UPI003C7D1E23
MWHALRARRGRVTAADFIPPRPALASGYPSLGRALHASVRDILSLFPESGFDRRLIPFRTLARRVLVVNEPELIRQVFIGGHAQYGAKSQHFQQALVPVIGDSMFLNSGAVWATRREVMARMLHPSRTGQFHPLFTRGAEELAESWSGEVDVAPGFAAATALAVMRALFGPDEPPEAAARLARAFATYESSVLAVDFAHVIGLPRAISGWQRRAAHRAASEVRAICAERIAAAGDTPGGLFAELRAACAADGAPLLDATQLVNEVATLLLAGSETSANALTWAFYLVARHPPTLARLRQEHAQVLGGRTPEAEDLPALPFTRAVIQEAMRLFPPVPYLSRQAAEPGQVAHAAVGRGDTVMAITWLLHRKGELWDAPHAFRPERFLPDAPRKPPRFGYLPFSLGPRVCAGAAFAMAEMTVFLATLLQRLDVSVDPGFVPVPGARLTLRPQNGMRLKFTRRG